MLSTVISTGAERAGADAAAGDFDCADGEEIDRTARKAAARPALNRFIDV
jgi:hypothetical protein